MPTHWLAGMAVGKEGWKLHFHAPFGAPTCLLSGNLSSVLNLIAISIRIPQHIHDKKIIPYLIQLNLLQELEMKMI